MNTYRFLIVVEDAGSNVSAYSPDLPGCVATGASRDEAERNMYEAIQLHIEGLTSPRRLKSRGKRVWLECAGWQPADRPASCRRSVA